MRTTSMTLNRSVVDTTNKSSNGWTESLPGGGVKSVAISASGILVEDFTARAVLDAFVGNEVAYGTVTFPTNPVATDSITVNGVLVDIGVDAAIGATVQDTVANIVTFLKASTNPLLTVADYDQADNQLVVRYKTAGTAGNAFTLAETGSPVVSGATLTGGGVSTHWNARVLYGTGDYWEGKFMIESLQQSGDHNDVATYEISLVSSDQVVFVE
jgi:predicted secreted protein